MFCSKLVFILILCLPSSIDGQPKIGLLYPVHGSAVSYEVLESLVEFSNITTPVVWMNYTHDIRDYVYISCDMVKEGVSLVITMGDSDDTDLFQQFFSHLQIPLITVTATSPTLHGDDVDFLVTMAPSDSIQARVMLDLLKEYSWKEVTIIASEDKYGIYGMLSLQDLIGNEPEYSVNEILMYDPHDDTLQGISEGLKSLKRSLCRVIIVFSSVRRIKFILSEAHSMKLMGSEYVWIVSDDTVVKPAVLSDNGSYLSYLDGLLGTVPSITKGPVYNQFKDSYTLFVPNSANHLVGYAPLFYDTLTLAEKVITQNKDLGSQNTTCTEAWINGQELFDKLVNISFVGVTGNISFAADGEKEHYTYDIVNFISINFFTVGVWREISGLTITGNVIFLNGTLDPPIGVANNLQGTHLKIGVIDERPFIDPSHNETCTTGICSQGLSIDILNRMSSDLGFTYSVVFPPDGKYGGIDATSGEWDGLIEMLIEGDVDLVGSPLATNTQRKAVIDFSYPFMDSGIWALMEGVTKHGDPLFYLQPYDTDVWACIIVAFVVMSILQCAFSRFSPYGLNATRRYAERTCKCESCRKPVSSESCLVEKLESREPGLNAGESIWTVGTGLVAQTGDILPLSPSGRCLLFSWWFFMLLIITLYTANLTAFLTLNTQAAGISSVLSLLSQTQYQWGIVGSSNTQTFLGNHANEEYHSLLDGAVILDTDEDGIKMVQNGSFVFIHEYPMLEYYKDSSCNKMVFVGTSFQQMEWAFGFPKSSPYKQLIDSLLLKYREEGYIDLIWSKYKSNKNSCPTSSSLTLDVFSIAGIFYTLAFGVAIALLCFVLEYVWVVMGDVRKEKGRVRHALKTRMFPKKRKPNNEPAEGVEMTVSVQPLSTEISTSEQCEQETTNQTPPCVSARSANEASLSPPALPSNGASGLPVRFSQ